jgi:endonuclease/exonuclease/phosphatase (EEP) superfamily protein YafD
LPYHEARANPEIDFTRQVWTVLADIRGIVTGLALASLLALLAISVTLGIPGQELLQTLRFHIALALLPLPVVLALLGARVRALIMLALIALSAGEGAALVLEQLARRSGDEAAGEAPSISLVSYNVLASNPDGSRIAGYIAATQPDLAIIMETPGIRSSLPMLDAIYPTRIGCSSAQRCDISLLSRLPVLSSSIYEFGPFRRERLIVARVDANGQPVTLIALHLSKPYFDDYAWIELTEIRTLLRNIEGPVIVAGDFNAAPWARSESRFARQMELVPPPTFPATWPAEIGDFGLPIDNIFTRDGALVTTIAAIPDPMGSNHRGLSASIALTGAGP